MKLWKRGIAMALAAVMLLALLTACGGSSGPAASGQPGGSGSSGTGGTEQPGKDPGTGEAGGGSGGETGGTGETGGGSGTEEPGKGGSEDENTKETEEQKAIKATVDALNAVRAEYGCKKLLTLDEQACAYAKEMAQVQLDGKTGKYTEQGEGSEYSKKCTEIRNKKVQNKASIGFGAVYNGYPIEKTYRKWADSTNETSAERNKALVRSKEATRVGVGVVQNPDKDSEYKYMVVVMTY